MKIGSTNIINAKIGSTNIQKVFSGSDLVWSAVDPDAQAFITAAAITDPTQQSAVNQLVVDLKGYGVWTKMKALYPFVGGTASQHKFNLKDPRDLDVAFRLVFNGGWTHSSTGALSNGTNGYADTFLNPSISLSQNSTNLSYYSRTNTDGNTSEIGVKSASTVYSLLQVKYSNAFIASINEFYNFSDNPSNTNGQGFYLGNRTASNIRNNWKNGTKIYTSSSTSQTLPSLKIYINAMNNAGTTGFYSNKECAFSSIGDGLTDTEAANFYTAVQAFQTTLGRSIGTQTVSDADAQAFVTNAGIVDQVEANAVNNLVIGLKADGLWSKMKAIYPFIGGTASTHKFNLKNPLDTDAAFRLTFSGGWTHSANGVKPNGTNGFADTFVLPNVNLINNNTHLSYYCRENISGAFIDFGTQDGGSLSVYNYAGTYYSDQYNTGTGRTSSANADTRGFITGSRTASNVHKLFRNGSQIGTTGTGSSSGLNTIVRSIFFGAARFNSTSALYFSSRQYSFASIGDGLTDTEASNFYTAVQNFQVALSRNV
jgi:hypothetical protein